MLRAARSLLAFSFLALAACGTETGDAESVGEAQDDLTQRQVVSVYERWEGRRDAIAAKVATTYGARVEAMTEAQYAAFLGSLDLATDDGLMTWAMATGMSIVALTRSSDFFYYDAHVLDPTVARTMTYRDYSTMTRTLDPATRQLSFTDKAGVPLRARTLELGAIHALERTGSVQYMAGGGEHRLHWPTLTPWVAPLSAVPNRADIAATLASMPLFLVKTLRGKAIYLSTASGRSYAVTMPVSNDVYALFAGMMPGAFFEANSPTQTRETLVHELCHVLDHTVLDDRYGSVLHPYRYPALVALGAERDALFEPRPASKTKGFVSTYATTNAQEDFAEHCRAYARDKAGFTAKAQAEAGQGSTLLASKLAFMEKVFATSAAFERVSVAVATALGGATDDAGGGGGDGGTATSCDGDATCRDAACLADLADVAEPARIVTEVTGRQATCRVTSAPQRVTYQASYYYHAPLRCTLASPPSAAVAATFTASMAARGYHGYSLVAGEVAAVTTSSVCDTY